MKKGDKGDKFVKQTYARNVVQAQKNKEKYMQNKAKLQGLGYSMDQFIANVKMTQVLGNSSEIVKQMNQMVNIKELNVAMMDMSREMEKMGMMQEMMDDVIQQDDEVDMGANEEEVNALINQVMSKNEP